MAIRKLLLTVFLTFLTTALKSWTGSSVYEFSASYDCFVPGDTLTENQILYNGREWKNLYYIVKGDQFLFSKEFLPGTLIIRGETFKTVNILYDIYKDEILIPNPGGGILQLNKERIDSFSFFFQNKTFHFARIPEDHLKDFANVLYKGKTGLYIRYKKKIGKLSDEGKYDKFYQESRTILVKDNNVYSIVTKRDLIRAFAENKEIIRQFVKKNHLRITVKDPGSIVPVIRYADSIQGQ